MEARRGNRRKPVVTVRPLGPGDGGPLTEVRMRELPYTFAGTSRGADRTWLTYTSPNGDLNQVYRTRYIALLTWESRTVHQIETEYYEAEFPEARLWMQQWLEETDEAWHMVMWGQRYPNDTAELNRLDTVIPRVLRPGAVLEGREEGHTVRHTVDPGTWLLDSCGHLQDRCLRLWLNSEHALGEHYIDANGDCLFGRHWLRSEADGPDEVVLHRDGRRYVLAYDQIPERLVFAIW